MTLLYSISVFLGVVLHTAARLITLGRRGDVTRAEIWNYAAARLGGRLPQSLGPEPCVWVHAVSVGEAMAAAPLIARWRERRPDLRFALSTITFDGAKEAAKTAADVTFIYPMDLPLLARAVQSRLNASVLIIIDGDFWKAMIDAVPRAAVVNAKLSPRSARRYACWPAYARAIFPRLGLVSAQTEAYAERYRSLGVPAAQVFVDGNLKLDAPVVAANPAALRAELGIAPGQPVCVFGSVHPEEEPVLRTVVAELLARHPELVCVLVPRHPDRFEMRFDTPRAAWLGRLGVLRDAYALARVAFVGGTFNQTGGHNLAEPALFGVPVVYGPNVATQLALHEIIAEYRAGVQAMDAPGVVSALSRFISAPETASENARAMIAASRGTVDRVIDRIEAVLASPER